MKTTVMNFSHALSASVMEELNRIFGKILTQVIIPVQVDLDLDLEDQVDSILRKAREIPQYEWVAIVPPSLSIISHVISARLAYAQSDSHTPSPIPAVYLKRGEVGFILGGVVSRPRSWFAYGGHIFDVTGMEFILGDTPCIHCGAWWDEVDGHPRCGGIE